MAWSTQLHEVALQAMLGDDFCVIHVYVLYMYIHIRVGIERAIILGLRGFQVSFQKKKLGFC